MAYEKNHYIPQFIQRRFANKISRYNIKTGKLIVKGSTKSAFEKSNIYPEWLEKMFGDLEVRIACFLDKKVLKSNEIITLTRQEIWLIKKFFAIQTLRSPEMSLKGVRHLDTEESMLQMGYKETKYENESDADYAYRTLRVILESNSYEDVLKHADVTYEACKWAALYNFCYLTFWDSTNCNEDFIITDDGMNCEHDKSRFKPFMFDKPYLNLKDEMIKRGYLYKSFNNNPSVYFQIEERMKHVHANYYLFPISATRTISLVNPFYRLYYDKIILDNIGYEPDVWPTLLSKEALAANGNKYENQGEYTENDLFYYDIKNLSLNDVIIVNCMMLDRVVEWLGFAEVSKIKRSLSTYLALPKLSQKIDYSKLREEIINLGYNMSKGQYITDMANKLVKYEFTQSEMECIKFFYDIIKNQ